MLRAFMATLLGCLLAACSSPAAPVPNPSATPTTSQATIANTPAPMPTDNLPGNRYAPSPKDSGLRQAAVYLTSAKLGQDAGRPALLLSGSLPDACHALRVAFHQPDAGGNIAVQVYSVADPEKICAQMLVDFEASVALREYPAGKYHLWVNGRSAGSFETKP